MRLIRDQAPLRLAWSRLDPGDTLTTENGRRFRVVAVVEIGKDAAVVDRLLEVEPEP